MVLIRCLIIKFMMQKSTHYRFSPAKSSRIKTQNTQTLAKSYLTDSPAYLSSRKNNQKSTCIDLQIQRSRISQKQGYSPIKLSPNKQTQQPMPFNIKSKYVVFKNLKQFELQLKTQKGKIDRVNPELKVFGITTFRGLRNSINSHQISAHIGEPTSFTLIEGFDGHYAASQFKKTFTNELNTSFRKQSKNSKEEPFQYTQDCIKSAFQHSKKQLKIAQTNVGDNSGASFLSYIAYKGITFVANCGSSGTLCMTISGKLLQIATPHTTNNQNELNRIIKQGGQLMQTTVNFPFKKQMGIRGPLRVFPEGLTLTRILGKSLSSSKKKQRTVAQAANYSRKGVLSELQINYVPSSQIRWLAIISSKIIEKVNSSRIKDIVEQQLSKCSESYTLSEAAEHCSKRVVLQSAKLGANESLSCLVLVANYEQHQGAPVSKKKQSWHPTVKLKQDETVKKLTSQPKSLTYIGKRQNFIQVQSQSQG